MSKWIAGMTGMLVLSGISLAAAGGGAAQDAAKIAAGKKVFDDNKCLACHALEGKGMKKYPLDGIGSKLSAEDIRKWIVSPAEMEAKQAVKQPLKMKAAKLPPADLDALVAFLESLKKK
jgi:mono/diheme cytochrome c family protein